MQIVNESDERIVLEPGEGVKLGDMVINRGPDGFVHRVTADSVEVGPVESEQLPTVREILDAQGVRGGK